MENERKKSVVSEGYAGDIQIPILNGNQGEIEPLQGNVHCPFDLRRIDEIECWTIKRVNH